MREQRVQLGLPKVALGLAKGLGCRAKGRVTSSFADTALCARCWPYEHDIAFLLSVTFRVALLHTITLSYCVICSSPLEQMIE